MASTPSSVRVVWDDRFTQYDFGDSHPMNPVRLDLTTRLARGTAATPFDEIISVSMIRTCVPIDRSMP